MNKGLGLTYDEIVGKVLNFTFGSTLYEITYILDSEHTLVRKATGKEGREQQQTIHLNPHTTLVTWKEENATIGTAYNDFKKGEVSVFIHQADGQIKSMSGQITIKEISTASNSAY